MKGSLVFSSPYLLIFCCALLLVLSFRRTRNFQPFTRVTLQVQIFFMTVPFILQPFSLLILRMSPTSGDWFADRRLISNGNYAKILSELLFIVLIALIFYYFGIVFFSRFTLHRKLQQPNTKWIIPIEILMILVLLGAIVLILYLLQISNPFLFAIRKVGATATCFALIFNERLRATDLQRKIFYFCGVTLTIAETVGYGFTKAPVLALAISYWIYTLHSKQYSKRNKIITGALLGLMLPVLFKTIQIYHLGPQTISQSSKILARYPEWFSPLLPFFQRFDLLSSLTDAYYAGVGTWLSISAYIREIYSALFWNYGFTGLNFGARWAKEISSKSISGNAYTGVSLSQGPIAEGYIVAGIFGSAIIILILVVFTIKICEKAYSNKFIAFIAVDMFAKNSLFEQGLVGNTERLTEALKVLVIFYLAGLFISVNKGSNLTKT